MDEDRFWSMIETARAAVGGAVESRRGLAEGRLPQGTAYSLGRSLDSVLPVLEDQLEAWSAEDLLAFDRILERKLDDIDRADIHARTGGSDDGFLYARGFIVALGREHYEAVQADPARAVPFAECERMCYLSFHLYHERFGEMPLSGISRESTHNAVGWPSADERKAREGKHDA